MSSQKPKILFYTGPGYLFTATSIGDLYEISQKFPVILVKEPLDPITNKAVENKKLFPKIEAIIPISQYSSKKRGSFSQNKRLHKTAKELIEKYKPAVVFAENDIYPFEMYLFRFAKRRGAIAVTRQGSLKTSGKDTQLYFHLIDLTRFPFYLPLLLRKFLTKVYRSAAHFLFYWLLPLTVRESPFRGQTSFINWNYTVGKRDADYYAVLTKKDYDLFLSEGVLAKKLVVLPHPLTRETKRIFNKLYFSKTKKESRTVLVGWPPHSIAFRASDLTPIAKDEFIKSRVKIVEILATHLSNWKIIIKPHPSAVKDIAAVKNQLLSLSPKITITDPKDSFNSYIPLVEVIVAPPPVSTVLYIAKLYDPQKIVLSLDLEHEFRGDLYKDYPAGVEYIDSEEEFIKTLQLIKSGRFRHMVKPTDKQNIDTATFLESVLRS